MLPLLQHIFDGANAARLRARQFHQKDVARVRIGLGPWVPPETIVPLLKELRRTFATLEVSVLHGGTATISDWLVGSEIDVGFTVHADGLTSRANVWSLFADDVVALMPVDHVLAQSAPPSVALPMAVPVPMAVPLAVDTLSDHDMVGRSGPEEAPQALAGLPGRVRHVGTTEEHLWSLLQSGLGVAVSTARRAAPPDIIRRPLHPPRAVVIHVATIPGRRLTQAAEALVRLARARDWQLAAA